MIKERVLHSLVNVDKHGQSSKYIRQKKWSTGHDMGDAHMYTVNVHCGTLCANLVTQDACKALSQTSDALDWVHNLGCLYKLFVNIATAA